MSGKPHKEGVAEVLCRLARCDELATIIRELTPAVAKLEAAHKEQNELLAEVAKLLERMDLESQGNWGFGGRMGWFVIEMRRQIIAELAATSSRVADGASDSARSTDEKNEGQR